MKSKILLFAALSSCAFVTQSFAKGGGSSYMNEATVKKYRQQEAEAWNERNISMVARAFAPILSLRYQTVSLRPWIAETKTFLASNESKSAAEVLRLKRDLIAAEAQILTNEVQIGELLSKTMKWSFGYEDGYLFYHLQQNPDHQHRIALKTTEIIESLLKGDSTDEQVVLTAETKAQLVQEADSLLESLPEPRN